MIPRNKLRMLEENEIELMKRNSEQALEADVYWISNASFVEELNKHQLFESIFLNNSVNNVSNTETTSSTPNDTNKSSSVQV